MRLGFAVLMVLLVDVVFAGDKLVIISPHRKSIQQEFVSAFKRFYKDKYKQDIEVDWLDQGGTSDDVRFIKARFKNNPASSGIDIFWGGGAAAYIDLDEVKLLAPLNLPPALLKELPDEASSVPMVSQMKTWRSSAMSSFGIFFNKRVLALEGMKEPRSWRDLGREKMFGQISLADPRRSGSANAMNNIILQSLGFEEGFRLLTAIGGNTRSFTHSSSDPIKAVVSGDVAVAMAIDFYAKSKIHDLGEENLGLVLPENETVLDPDPIAILVGAPHEQTAKRFVQFVLGKEAQKLWLLPKGLKDGPKFSNLGRLAVNTETYKLTEGRRLSGQNPFNSKGFFKFDADKASKLQRVLNDLIGSTIVDPHRLLKKSWKKAIKGGLTPEEFKNIGQSPVTEKELLELADKWHDNVLRNRTINIWSDFAAKKYESLLAH